LTPGTATAVSPRAWDTTAAKRRQAERLGSVEHIVTKIIAGIEKNIRHGCTDDNVTRLVAEWAGPVGKLLRVEGVVTRAGKKTLHLAATHSAVIMELRGRLPALKAALKPTGIEEVKL
jgi:hypothetical protein